MQQKDAIDFTAPRSLLRALIPAATEPSLIHTLVRPDDQVRLRFELVNGTVDTASNTIVGLLGEEPIYYQIWFGPQHVVEQPVTTATTPSTDARESRIAGESRIVIEIPDGTPFTVATLLDLSAYALRLDERAQRNYDGDDTTEPGSDVTAIEVPAALVLSPTRRCRFVANTGPITTDNITELWRARLARVKRNNVVEPPASKPKLRAIWNRPEDPDFNPPRPVDSIERDNLIAQTTGKDSTTLPVGQLWLSSQGAFMDADGAWAQGILAAYRHRVISGRDIHVEVVERGFLTPFGHPASITTLTERIFLADTNNDSTASLTSDEFISITTPTIDTSTLYMPNDGRGIPFVSLSATDPGSGPVGSRRVTMPNGASIKRNSARIITRDGSDLQISYSATDMTGQGNICFELPAIFVSESVAYEPRRNFLNRQTVLQKLKRWYKQGANADFTVAELSGQPIAWAPPPADPERGRAGSIHTTNRIQFSLDRPDLTDNDPATIEQELSDLGRPAFYPAVAKAWVIDLSATTSMGGEPPEAEVTVAARYLEHGTGLDNVDLGYLDLVNPIIITPTTDATGMISTSLNIETFGQGLGAGVNLLSDTGIGTSWDWDPITALAGVPKLLGNLDLANLVGEINIGTELSGQGLPTMSVELIAGADILDPPAGVCVQFTWEPELKSFPSEDDDNDKPKTFIITNDFKDEFTDIPEAQNLFADDTHALLSLRTCTPGDTTFEVALERFAIQLPPGLPAVAIFFEQLKFHDLNGSSSVNTDIADWMFVGQLGWLEPIKDILLNTMGLGAPTFENGIFIDSDMPVPNLTLGIVNITGMQIGLGFAFPDEGDSSIDFAMSSRENPFAITVFGVGGTGSFSLVVDARQIVYIEGSLAVTYEMAVNVFIAAASLSVALGVFVIYEEQELTFGAYAELNGSLSFIGIVKISGSVMVALLYNVNTRMLRGVAAVTGEVSSPFGKSSVTHDVEVEVMLGDNTGASSFLATDAANNLSFQERYTDTQWTEYCNAFAA